MAFLKEYICKTTDRTKGGRGPLRPGCLVNGPFYFHLSLYITTFSVRKNVTPDEGLTGETFFGLNQRNYAKEGHCLQGLNVLYYLISIYELAEKNISF